MLLMNFVPEPGCASSGGGVAPIPVPQLGASETWCVRVIPQAAACNETATVFGPIEATLTTVVSGAPGGPYLGQIDFATSADADLMEAFIGALGPDQRIREDVSIAGAGVVFVGWFGPASFSAPVRTGPTQLQVTVDFQTLPPALSAPCVDPHMPDIVATYANLTSFYDTAGNGGVVGNGSFLTFTIFDYTALPEIIGSQSIIERRKTNLPNGTVQVTDWEVNQTTGAETPGFVSPPGAVWTPGECPEPAAALVDCVPPPIVTTVQAVPQGFAFRNWSGKFGQSGAVDLSLTPNSGNALLVDTNWWLQGPLQSFSIGFQLNDGEGLVGITADTGLVPFGPVLWDLATDPTGTTFLAALQTAIGAALVAATIPFGQVFTNGSVTGSAIIVTIEVTDTNNLNASPHIMTFESSTGQTLSGNYQFPIGELDYEFGSVTAPSPDCVLTGLTVSAVMQLQPGAQGMLGLNVGQGTLGADQGSGPIGIFGDGPQPMLNWVATDGNPHTYTATIALSGTDPLSGPYTLTAADLGNVQGFIVPFAGGHPPIAVDGMFLTATFSCPDGTASASQLVTICQTQLDQAIDGLTSGIVNGLAPTTNAYKPFLREGTDTAVMNQSMTGLRSLTILVLAGPVQVTPPHDPPIILGAGETVKWEITAGTDTFVSDVVTIEGLALGAKWRIAYEAV